MSTAPAKAAPDAANDVRTPPPATRRRGVPTGPLPWLSFVLVLALWELVGRSGRIDKAILPAPSAVASAGYHAMQAGAFWNDVWVSGREFLVGYGLAVLVGVPFGLLTGWFRRGQYMFDPWLNALNSTPHIAMLPMLVLWFGLGMRSKVAVIFLGVVIPVAINTFGGVRTVDRRLLDVAYTYGASRLRLLRSVVLPSVVPFALVGMRLGIGRAVSGVMVGEFYTSQAGLGYYIFVAGRTLQTDRLLFGAAFLTLFALAGFRGIGALERRFYRWRPRVGSA